MARFGNRLRIEYPRAWLQVKKDRDLTCYTVPITYVVSVTITDFQRIGTHQKVKPSLPFRLHSFCFRIKGLNEFFHVDPDGRA
ncbi:hypothetical protein [Brevibacillus brevis]|uniref:Uncharacterized protein n=1 Tax=Brevibacillus brevis TaxID=1393 RepID=A0ABY9T121_BREBE|nr:hypothetical protein [Brevibacillus brevis]WNC13691.1 hypothetical protein RGB73_23845 [Brevibacillus brevis]